ncbi:MAG TPA: type II toxin-antitoxin system VapC family toxin [Streptosporangiaceae bacterium]
MIVADCSAIIFYLTDDGPAGQQARERVSREDSLAAPGLLDYEVMSALVGLSRGRRGGKPKLGKRQTEKAMATFRLLPVERHETLALWDRVWELSANLSVYDAQYVALSEALDVPLLTSDHRIVRAGIARCQIDTITGPPAAR